MDGILMLLLKNGGPEGLLGSTILVMWLKIKSLERRVDTLKVETPTKEICELLHEGLATNIKRIDKNIGEIFEKIDDMPEKIINLMKK